MGTLHIRCRIIIRTPKGTLILTTTYMHVGKICSIGALYRSIYLLLYIIYIYTHMDVHVYVSTDESIYV